MSRSIEMLVIHCSDSGPSTTVADIDSWHKARGWKGIGYHWVILADGTLVPGRPEEEIGAHCENDNLFSIGICLVGKTSFSQKQFDTLDQFVLDWKRRFNRGNESIFGHRDRPSGKAQKKSCPNWDVRERYAIEK